MKKSIYSGATGSGRRNAKFGAVSVVAALVFSASVGLASAQMAPSLGLSGSFAALSGTAVTCTDSTVTGDLGAWPGTAVTQTNCVLDGDVHPGDEAAMLAYVDFLNAYGAFADLVCDFVLPPNLAGVTVSVPGVYCTSAASTTTGGVLTISGPADGEYVFKIGTGGTGALTGTDFSVVLEGGESPCNVYWWVAEAVTMTGSELQGTILSGAAVTITGGSIDGNILAQAGVTMTNAGAVACEADGTSYVPQVCERDHGHHNHHDHGHRDKHCNQGVGNGPEGCDPGNSNHGDDDNSNDENGGKSGHPGRRGGNGNGHS